MGLAGEAVGPAPPPVLSAGSLDADAFARDDRVPTMMHWYHYRQRSQVNTAETATVWLGAVRVHSAGAGRCCVRFARWDDFGVSSLHARRQLNG